MLQIIHSIYLRPLRNKLFLPPMWLCGYSADFCEPSSMFSYSLPRVCELFISHLNMGSHSAMCSLCIKHPQPNCLIPTFKKKSSPLNESSSNTQTSYWLNGTPRPFPPVWLQVGWRVVTGDTGSCQIPNLSAFIQVEQGKGL